MSSSRSSDAPAALAAELGVELVSADPMPGGDINEAWRCRLSDGRDLFLKSRGRSEAGEYAGEAAGLEWLRVPDGPSTPRVIAHRDGALGFLALEWLEPGAGSAGPRAERALGRALAVMHRSGAAAHGATPEGVRGDRWRIGPLVVDSEPVDRWPAFYAGSRLEPLARIATDRGALPAAAGRAIGRICDRIDELAGPAEPPARLHGDLWRGNVHADSDGVMWLIDPAAYGGHREVDLAMLELFGAPSVQLLAGYEEVYPMADGRDERLALYQLLPLLVHAALFGGGYGASVAAAAARYG